MTLFGFRLNCFKRSDTKIGPFLGTKHSSYVTTTNVTQKKMCDKNVTKGNTYEMAYEMNLFKALVLVPPITGGF